MQHHVMILTEASFATTITNTSLPILVHCWAEWSPDCQSTKLMMDELALIYEGRAIIANLHSDENPKVITDYHVLTIPTCILFYTGQEVKRILGSPSIVRYQEAIEEYVRH